MLASLFALLLLFAYGVHAIRFCSVRVLSNGDIESSSVFDKDAHATGSFQDMDETGNGWGVLEIHTNPSLPDDLTSFAAGVVEGELTAQRMYQQFLNTRETLSVNVSSYLEANTAYVNQQISSNSSSSYWYQVSLVQQQLHGLYVGYQRGCSDDECLLTQDDMLFLQLHGDLQDLIPVLDDNKSELSLYGSGSCSALIRLTPDFSDVYVSQVTWTSYANMLRIWKLYDFPFRVGKQSLQIVPGARQSFASYPGRLVSGDDYYVIMPSQLVVLETTIGNDNQTLNQFIQPKTVLYWLRNLVANRLANSGSDWTDIFSWYNSGTYNNEWMVVDMKQFRPSSHTLSPNLVWMLDQLPGNFVRADITSRLLTTSSSPQYIPSYNVPYFPEIYNMSGAAAAAAKGGDWYSYDKCPRALIFARDAPNVNSLVSMQSLMRYNDFENDPLSRCVPDCTPLHASGENAIAARSDLNPADGVYPISALGHRAHGAIDAKLVTATLIKAATPEADAPSWAISGPTYDQQPVFQWSTSSFDPPVPHVGHPDAFDFPWTLFNFTTMG